MIGPNSSEHGRMHPPDGYTSAREREHMPCSAGAGPQTVAITARIRSSICVGEPV